MLTVFKGIIATMVQMFYARRILVLTKNRWVTALVVLSSAVSGRAYSAPDYTGGRYAHPLIVCAIGTAIGVAMRPDFSGLVILDVSYPRRASLTAQEYCINCP